MLPITSYAQSIKGRVIDELSQPLPFANIILLSLNDSLYIQGTISKDNGMFIYNQETSETSEIFRCNPKHIQWVA